MRNDSEVVLQGSVYMVDLDPTKGHEQSGKRPVLVVSNNDFNRLTRLVKVVPITSKKKDFPMEMTLPNSLITYGQVLVQHERTIDLKHRNHEFIEMCPEDFVRDVIELLSNTY